jgi:hypothetical protein
MMIGIVFAREAEDLAVQAIAEGVARISLTWDELYQKAKARITRRPGSSWSGT